MTYNPYSVRFRPEERRMLKEVARRLERSQQETVRAIVREVYQIMTAEPAKELNANKSHK